MYCKQCYEECAPGTKICPKCGAKISKGSKTPIILAIIIIVLLAVIGGLLWYILGGGNNDDADDSSGSSKSSSNKTIDAFAGITVTFSGVSPTGTAEIYIPDNLSDFEYVYDQSQLGKLANGDSFVISISDESIENYKNKNKKTPAANEKTFTVSGLGQYVTSLSQIDEATKSAIDAEAERYFVQAKSQLEANEVSNNRHLMKGERYYASIEKTGSFLNWERDMSVGDVKNEYYVIYAITIHHKLYDENTGDFYESDDVVYWYMYYNNVILYADGTLSLDATAYAPCTDLATVSFGNVGFFFGDGVYFIENSLNYHGMESPDTIYSRYALTKDVSWEHENDFSD